jgi:hypothetical protein
MREDEWKRVSKEAVITQSKYCPLICLEGLRKAVKTPITIAGVRPIFETSTFRMQICSVTTDPFSEIEF